jgi:Cu/Ag efflux protein CusF
MISPKSDYHGMIAVFGSAGVFAEHAAFAMRACFRQYNRMRILRKLRTWHVTGAFLLAGAMLLASCHSSDAKRYRLEGRVLSVDASAGQAEIDCKEIPGFMPAMAMQFAISDAKALSQLAPGDQIAATLVVPPDGAAAAHLENVAVVHKAE